MPKLFLYNTPRMRFAQDIACACNWSGYTCMIVGGFVRDVFLGREPKDLDMMSPIPVTLLKNLPVPNCTIVPTGEQYGTISFVREGVATIEVTVCREDFGDITATDNRKEVYPTFIHSNFAGPARDISRRDFTINGLMLDPFTGRVFDFVGGLDDLLMERLRFIGDPVERCREDALRVYRYVRFATCLGFKIDPIIFDVVQDETVALRLLFLSAERVRDEFLKTIMADNGADAARAMTLYLELGLVGMHFPELNDLVDQPQNIYHTEDVWGHTLMAVENSKPQLLNRLFALWHDLGKPETAEFKADEYGYSFHDHAPASARIAREMAHRLRFGNKTPVYLDFLCFLIEHHMDAFVIGKTSRMLQRVGITKFGEELGAQYVLDTAWDVGRSDFFARAPVSHAGDKIKGGNTKLLTAYQKIQDYIKDKAHPALSVRTLAVNGHDVMTIMGVPAGPQVGQVLDELLELVQNQTLENNREQLLEVLRAGLATI